MAVSAWYSFRIERGKLAQARARRRWAPDRGGGSVRPTSEDQSRNREPSRGYLPVPLPSEFARQGHELRARQTRCSNDIEQCAVAIQSRRPE
jgi:hypothetical protein